MIPKSGPHRHRTRRGKNAEVFLIDRFVLFLCSGCSKMLIIDVKCCLSSQEIVDYHNKNTTNGHLFVIKSLIAKYVLRCARRV